MWAWPMAMPLETGRPWRVKDIYSPSPNLSAMRSRRACRAVSASAPSVSMVITAPLAAASIITPMMLFALTRRPLRSSQTSQGYRLAVWVSLAEARAWSPSLLMISTSVLGMVGGLLAVVVVSFSRAPPHRSHRLFRHGAQRLGSVLGGHAEAGGVRWASVEHVAGALEQGFPQVAVGDEKDADHGSLRAIYADCSQGLRGWRRSAGILWRVRGPARRQER